LKYTLIFAITFILTMYITVHIVELSCKTKGSFESAVINVKLTCRSIK